MFTIFDLFNILCPIAGMLALAMPGYKQYGIIGAILGGAAGFYAGLVIGRLPDIMTTNAIHRDLKRSSIDSLRSKLQTEWFLTLYLIGELIRRGANVEEFRPHVKDLLKSKVAERRSIGWNSARLWFPEMAKRMDGFNPFASADKCRKYTDSLDLL